MLIYLLIGCFEEKVDFSTANAPNAGIESLIYFFELTKHSLEVIK